MLPPSSARCVISARTAQLEKYNRTRDASGLRRPPAWLAMNDSNDSLTDGGHVNRLTIPNVTEDAAISMDPLRLSRASSSTSILQQAIHVVLQCPEVDEIYSGLVELATHAPHGNVHVAKTASVETGQNEDDWTCSYAIVRLGS